MRIEKKVCAFVDILGFKALIQKSYKNGTSLELFEFFKEGIEEGVKSLSHKWNENLNFKTFSDNILITYDRPEGESPKKEIDQVITETKYYQLSLLYNGIFVRGGISYDELKMDENSIFGMGLVKAYEIESSKANYPIVMLDEKVLKELESNEEYSFNEMTKESLLRDKSTDNVFINYLYADGLAIPTLGIINDFYSKHKDNILKALDEHKDNESVLKKYIWLGNYHNYCVENYYFKCVPDGSDGGIYEEISTNYENIPEIREEEGFSPLEYKDYILSGIKDKLLINMDKYNTCGFETF